MASRESYEAAKWLKLPILIDEEEFKALFSLLDPFILCSLGRVVTKHEALVSRDSFLTQWSQLIKQLRRGEITRISAMALSREKEDFFHQELGEDRVIVRIRRPVIQMQAHFFTYSPEEEKIYSGVFGKESIFWGVQFSYPQIFLDPSEQIHVKVDDRFPNTELFRTIQRWSRNATRPIGINGKSFPLRIGKRALLWINEHPQLCNYALH